MKKIILFGTLVLSNFLYSVQQISNPLAPAKELNTSSGISPVHNFLQNQFVVSGAELPTFVIVAGNLRGLPKTQANLIGQITICLIVKKNTTL